MSASIAKHARDAAAQVERSAAALALAHQHLQAVAQTARALLPPHYHRVYGVRQDGDDLAVALKNAEEIKADVVSMKKLLHRLDEATKHLAEDATERFGR